MSLSAVPVGLVRAILPPTPLSPVPTLRNSTGGAGEVEAEGLTEGEAEGEIETDGEMLGETLELGDTEGEVEGEIEGLAEGIVVTG